MVIKRAQTNGIQAAKINKQRDMTPPDRPHIRQSIAFAPGSKDALLHVGHESLPPDQNKPASFYLEVEGFELGAKLELINLSANPAAQFDGTDTIALSADDKGDVSPSGVDLQT